MKLLETDQGVPKKHKLYEFINEIETDKRLAPFEIDVQKVWVDALAEIGFFSDEDRHALIGIFDECLDRLADGTFPWTVENEDIHMHLEAYVTARLGEIGKKMHTGRSRNDLVATTLRLYCRDLCEKQRISLQQVIHALVLKAEEGIDVIVPGITHTQHGQPVRLAHILLAHAEAFTRDIESLDYVVAAMMKNLPLGAAAMAGTTLNIDLDKMARALGFQNACRNAYDAVGERDFILKHLDVCSHIALHLSRLSEDIVYWSSSPVAVFGLPDEWSTYSSIMPNKRNPEVAELTRGRAAHVISCQTNAYMLMRTAPTSYCGELQEIKGVLMRAADNLDECFAVWPSFIAGMKINARRAAALLNTGHILATKMADQMVIDGMSHRDAYAQVKTLVDRANENNCQVHELGSDVLGDHAITPEHAVEMSCSPGGTARRQVLESIDRLRTSVVYAGGL